MAPTNGLAGAILAVLALGFCKILAENPVPCASACGAQCAASQLNARAKQTPGRKGIAMAAIEALVFLVATGFGLVLIATVIVIVGVHQEERRWTLNRGEPPPTIAAVFARRVLGAHHVAPVAKESSAEDLTWAGRMADELVGR
jgi:hypothetical protein